VARLAQVGAVFYRYRKYFIPGALVLVLAFFRPVVFRGDRWLDTLLDLVGVGVALCGQTLRAAVIGYEYIRRGGKDGKAYADTLVTGGLFAHARNPLYVGNLVLLLGLLIIFNSPGAYLVVFPLAVFFYAAIVAAEEAYLRERFGEPYEEYCRRVPRWIPDLRGLRETVSGLGFNWRRLVRKEYGSAYAWILAAVLLRVWVVSTHAAYAEERPYLAWYLLPIGLATLGWATARFMKKQRRLTDRPAFSATQG
jgi:protein-S-isoprenylcysteine O-methyltransferase Ste14